VALTKFLRAIKQGIVEYFLLGKQGIVSSCPGQSSEKNIIWNAQLYRVFELVAFNCGVQTTLSQNVPEKTNRKCTLARP
jgi:hypothetical protein